MVCTILILAIGNVDLPVDIRDIILRGDLRVGLFLVGTVCLVGFFLLLHLLAEGPQVVIDCIHFLSGELDIYPAEGVHDGGHIGEVHRDVVPDIQAGAIDAEILVEGTDGQLRPAVLVGSVNFIRIVQVAHVVAFALDLHFAVPQDRGHLDLPMLVIHREDHHHIGKAGKIPVAGIHAEQGNIADAVIHNDVFRVNAQGLVVLGDGGGGQIGKQAGGNIDQTAAKEDEQEAKEHAYAPQHRAAPPVLFPFFVFLGGRIAGNVLKLLVAFLTFSRHGKSPPCLT